MSSLRERYNTEIVPALSRRFAYKNPMQIPRVSKVVVNIGVGEGGQNPKAVDEAVTELSMIAGQKPVVTRARRSIANFKLRKGMPIGVMVTLRGERMYDFLEKLFYIALPRVRDFRGISADGFDGHGNYSLGLREQLVFPEIDRDKVDKIRGMNVSIVTTAETDEEARELLRLLGAPFRD